MERGQRAAGEVFEERKLQQIHVEMDHIEFLRAPSHLVQHRKVSGDVGLERRRVQTDCVLADRNQLRVRPCVAAGEQRHVVSELHQRVGKVGDNPLGASIEFWRDGFDQRGDLGDFQRTICGARHASHRRVQSSMRLQRRFNRA